MNFHFNELYFEKNKKAEEDHNSLLKKITALDLEVDKASEQLTDVTTKLEAANKQSADVSY